MFSRKSFRFVSIVVLALLAAMLGATFAGAQQATGTEVEFVGLVEAMTLDTLTVNGQVIDVSQAEISVAVSLGVPVKIEGTLMPDGSIVAREVKAPDAAGGLLPGEFEIVGLLTGIEGADFIIGQVRVDASLAEIKPGVALGALVRAHVSQNADGRLIAREIEPVVDDAGDDNANVNANDNTGAANDNNANDNQTIMTSEEVEIVGTLTAMTADAIVVGGQTISIVGAEIKDALVLGALVKVHAVVVDGQLVAREVELVSAQDRDRDRDRDQLGDDNSNENQNQNRNRNENENENENENGNDNGGAVVPPGCTPMQPAGWTVYTVRPGDTLSGIAAATGASLNDLAERNCIANAAQIRVGQPLFVPRQPVGNTGSGSGNTNSNVNGNDNHDDDHNGNVNSNDNSDDHGGNDNNDDHGDSNDNGDDHGSNDNDDD